MTSIRVFGITAAAGALIGLTACHHLDDTPDFGDGGADTDSQTGSDQQKFAAVDLLVVVDDSSSMAEEQRILATSLFSLFSSLVDPLPTSNGDRIDDLRVAVVSTNMGLSWGGNPYQDGDGWPTTIPNACEAAGDDGLFQTYSGQKTVRLDEGVIECDADASQCPAGWQCTEIGGDGVGVCADPGGDGTIACPTLAWDYLSTSQEAPDPQLALGVACLTALGTEGCGFEQQLQSAARGLTRDGQTEFVRDDALLVVMIVTDEEDCSIEDGPGLFSSPEIQGVELGLLNVACGENPEDLYTASHYRDLLVELKGGNPAALVYAAIAGVPIDPACEGTGDQIGGCLDHADMILHQQYEETATGAAWFYRPACERYAGDELITRARPGRRFVELATELGASGYVASICNPDWSAAFEELAALIHARLES